MKTRSTCKRIRLAVMFWMSACMVASLVYVTTTARAAITDRKREPVIVKATVEKFPRWIDGAPASSLELWTFRESYWQIVPYQVDEVSGLPQNITPFIDPDRFSGAMCQGGGNIPPGSLDAPCEFLYDLRGTSPPSGTFSVNDELVFLAGTAGACDVPTNSWPDAGLDAYRYRIQVADNPQGTEAGCVYLFRRVAGSHPILPDLVTYDPIGDGVPSVCRPTSDACGTIRTQTYDVDGDGTSDLIPYRMDFWGNWTADRWQLGETAMDPSQDTVDIIKWSAPAENEELWDLQRSGATCASFVGTIDGPLRVIRVIQGAASGAFTRKLEIAYPGEVLMRVYLRVHPVGGPIDMYEDVNESTMSPAASPAKVFTVGHTTEGNPFDIVDGDDQSPTFLTNSWFQVSADIGSFLDFPGDNKTIVGVTEHGEYDDSSAALRTGYNDWDEETGDRAAARTQLGGGGHPLPDTQNPLCEDPRTDLITPIRERILLGLSAGRAASNAGEAEVTRRMRGVLSQCITEEQQSGGGGKAPCIPVIVPVYDHDGGPARFHIDGCDGHDWNVYRVQGGGVTRRIGTLGPGEIYYDVTMGLNEERTYKATAFSSDFSGCTEGSMSGPVVVLHDDTVAPPPPQDLVVVAGVGQITASWISPIIGDIAGFKVLAASQSGGPYLPAHTGILPIIPTNLNFPAVGGGTTHYIIAKAVDKAGNWSSASNEAQVTVP